MVDPGAFGTFNLGEIMERGQRMRMNQMREDEYRGEQQKRKRLSELLPGAVKGDRGAIDELAGISPEMFMKLDDRQREQAKAELADLAQAVRWADNPEKWQYVQQHFGQKGIDLSGYSVADREKGMIALGKLGEYLDAAPKSEYRSVEAGGSLIDVSGGNPRVVIAPNPGGMETGAPVRQASGLAPGKVVNGYRYRGGNPNNQGSWEPVNGGPTQQASGGFPPSGY